MSIDWGFLSFLAEAWFVVPWYAVGIAGAILVGHDVRTHNTPLKPAMKWAWPIILLFFSVIGLALYYGTARAPGIGRIADPKRKKEAHHAYEQSMPRRVNGAVIHCVAGDGLGIMTAMVIARALDFSFWQEFWFEYLVGFLFGWFIFQLKSMLMMTDSKPMALWMAFRSEFMSMLTVMGGMGAVMGYVTPLAVTAQPDPMTYAFWGFGMLGLLVGYAFTWPMNYMLVRIGWKHGMGSMDKSIQVRRPAPRYAVFATMWALGAIALAVPAWLVEMREGIRLDTATSPAGPDRTARDTVAALAAGLGSTLDIALEKLETGQRSHAAHAIDAAHRSAKVGEHANSAVFRPALRNIEASRQALHVGREETAREALAGARSELDTTPLESVTAGAPGRFTARGATLLNTRGVVIGEVVDIRGGDLRVALDGGRDIWGFLDLGGSTRSVPATDVLIGPTRAVGMSLAVIGEDGVRQAVVSR